MSDKKGPIIKNNDDFPGKNIIKVTRGIENQTGTRIQTIVTNENKKSK